MELYALPRMMKNPIVIVGIVAIAIRLIIAPLLNCSYDDQDFGQIVKNIQVGFGLYGLDCYFYSPGWGYVVGLQTLIMNLFANIPVLGERFTDMLQWESFPNWWLSQSATLLTPEFTVVLKIPIIISDILVGIVLYRYLVKESGDNRKALLGTSLWLLFPTVIVMSSMKVMFDSMPALFLLLTFILIKKDMTFVAGMMYGASILLKFFPLASILVIVAYLLVKHKGDGKAFKSLIKGILGMVFIFLVMYLPVILNGEFMESIKFVTMRAGSLYPIVSTLAVVNVFLAGILMYTTPKEKADYMLPIYLILPMVAPVMLKTNPNYMLVFLPLLIIALMNRRDVVNTNLLKISLILLAVSSILAETIEWNFTYLVGVAEYYHVIEPNVVFSWFNAVFDLWGGAFANGMQPIIEGMQFTGQGIIIIAIFLSVFFLYRDRIKNVVRGLKDNGN